ncbi:MAG: M15 family metallopeptidase [Bacilli bacterium]|nr:M15 family metallopeptidase [Bacilli bacterium]
MRNKKAKLKKRSILILVIILIVITIVIVNPIKLYNKYQLKNLGFSDISVETILNNGLKKQVLELNYNKTLDKVLESPDFNIKNFDIYKELEYIEFDNYTKNINSLIDKGYTKEEINYILKSANNDSLKEFLEKDYVKNISKFLQYDFAILSNLDRYTAYQNENNIDSELVVIYVNIGLDKKFYEDVTTTNVFSYDMLVNKYHGVSEEFEPKDIVDVPEEYGKNQKLNEETLKNFIKMSDDCKVATNYKLMVRSGYRDLKEQEKTYNTYLKTYGKVYAENYVTHPRFSEHHTGLAIDVKAESTDVFANSKESKWTYENAYKYGFILRYKKEDENITGIKYESWHFRYVGVDIATYLHDHEMTYEEYYVRFLNK